MAANAYLEALQKENAENNESAVEKNEDPLEGIVIPPQPKILLELKSCGGKIDKIIELIEQDAGISAGVIKTINSPLYSLRSTISSISKAVQLLGLDSIISIVNTLALRASIRSDMQVQMEEFWDSSTDVAKAAGAIASETKLCDRDVAYTAGLFHDCGIPLLLQKHKNYFDILKQAYEDETGEFVKIERNAIKIDHAFVGYKVCKLWNLSENVCLAIRYHHHGNSFLKSEKFNQKAKILGATIMLAEHIAEIHRTLGGKQEDKDWGVFGETVLDVLDMNKDDYENIKEYIYDSVYV